MTLFLSLHSMWYRGICFTCQLSLEYLLICMVKVERGWVTWL